jgi:hypothetical protein
MALMNALGDAIAYGFTGWVAYLSVCFIINCYNLEGRHRDN